jgi:hypothetical protein
VARPRYIQATAAAAAIAALCGCDVGQPWFEYRVEPAPTAARPSPPPAREPEFTIVLVAPLETTIGNPITLSAEAESPDGDTPAFRWRAVGGIISEPEESDTTYTCLTRGHRDVTVTASTRGGTTAMAIPVTCQ